MLEGATLGTSWDWKDTLGPLKNRPGFQGVWGYQQTHGLGLVEYLEWSEDMDLEIGEQVPVQTQWYIANTRIQSSVATPVLPSTATSPLRQSLSHGLKTA
jgi:hypothetical protein